MEKRITRRRLHTLSGAGALGFFLLFHLLTQASALGDHGTRMGIAGRLERSGVVSVLELFLVLVPLAFHVGYGVVLFRQPLDGAEVERYGSPERRRLQRISGVLVLVFVLGHLWETWVQKLAFGLDPAAFHTVLVAHLSWTWAGIPLVALLYLIGLAGTCFHFANGLVAATATVRTAEDPARRRKMEVGSVIVGSILFVLGAATVIALATGTRLHAGTGDDSGSCGPGAVPSPAAAPSR